MGNLRGNNSLTVTKTRKWDGRSVRRGTKVLRCALTRMHSATLEIRSQSRQSRNNRDDVVATLQDFSVRRSF